MIDKNTDILRGSIDNCNGYLISGWIFGSSKNLKPVLLQNNLPLQLDRNKIDRPDVKKNLNIGDGKTGFSFKIDSLKPSDTFKLYAVSPNKSYLLDTKKFNKTIPELNFINQIDIAEKISKSKNSIGIICWDSAHNPLGRAKVLYDIVSTNTETVILSYINKDFGTKIWSPLQNSNINHLQIPWHQRSSYEESIKKRNITFDTLWISKNRYPSFLLASLFSHKNTSLILDIDDLEREFEFDEDVKFKSYGRFTTNLSNLYTNKIKTRTSPSVTLANKFNSNIIRHTRKPKNIKKIKSDLSIKKNINLVFIGTIRDHKNLNNLVEEIIKINKKQSLQSVYLHIYGDYKLADKKTLISNYTFLYNKVQFEEIDNVISHHDIYITGFPNNASIINKYQISSKIGDALSVNMPVLVPESDSIEGIEKYNGVYIFNKNNLNEVIQKVIKNNSIISLPNEFNTSYVYKDFLKVYKKSLSSDKSSEVLNINKNKEIFENENGIKNILLFWKQSDSGIYGRRIDILARDLKTINSEYNIRIIEIRHENDQKNILKDADLFISDSKIINNHIESRINSFSEINKVQYSTILYKDLINLENKLNLFLLNNNFTKSDTAIIIFPFIDKYEVILKSIKNYKVIVDVVDNQLEWASNSQKPEIFSQFSNIFNLSNAVVFNSKINQSYFVENGLINDKNKINVIENWYNFPENHNLKTDNINKDRKLKNIFYSGNLKERFDWKLLKMASIKFPELDFHIVGTTSLKNIDLEKLLERNNIFYYGPLEENKTLKLLESMDLMIMPHLSNKISKYMNPLKIHMYKKLGFKIISTNVEGISYDSNIVVAHNHDNFLKAIQENKIIKKNIIKKNNFKNAVIYEKLIKSLFAKN